MNGPQDVGGMMGFGPVAPDPSEPLFHADWEKRALGLTLACGALGHWTIDEGRHARESLPPAVYYGSSYYAIWLRALVNLLETHGEVAPEELQGLAMRPGLRADRVLTEEKVPTILSKGAPYDRPATTDPAFAVGDAVRTLEINTHGHNRLPGYAKDKPGVVEAVRGHHVYPDASAEGREEAVWLYTVRFDAADLWGEGDHAVSIDAFEPYLTRA